MAFNYSNAFNNLAAGNFTSAVTLTYTTPLGQYFYWFVLIATIIMAYVKTQSIALALIVGIISLTVLRVLLSVAGDWMFYIIIVLGTGVLMAQLWLSR